MRRSLRDTLLDHLDERDDLVQRVADAGLGLMRQHLVQVVADATPHTATPESVQAATQRMQSDLLRLLAGAHVTAHELMERHRTERRASVGPRGAPIMRADREARRAARSK